ncbi:MAG: diaminopimelate dehydrogenase [Clostridiales bacterium]|jgi:diaminopimelate dehydrogenase|nr:diaminopimelate dehydrogenase [Clostridiales bacterium]
MDKINIAIIGYGNIGKCAVDAVLAAPDMALKGIVELTENGRQAAAAALSGVEITDDIKKLGAVDVALLCTPTRNVRETALHCLSLGINTVDGFDIHTSINDLRQDLDKAAKANGRVSVISAGWDPGSDSIIRTLLQACAPKGVTYTNFGPGMSMGHTVAAKSVPGVKAALSMTIPLGTGIHRRMVYIELADGADYQTVADAIKADDYFAHDETHVHAVDSVDALLDKGHGVQMIRKGVSGKTDNQLFEYSMKINNPALTSQVMTACARAATRQRPGAYTMIELPVIDLLPGDREAIIRTLV